MEKAKSTRIKQHLQSSYKAKDKEEKRSVRADRRKDCSNHTFENATGWAEAENGQGYLKALERQDGENPRLSIALPLGQVRRSVQITFWWEYQDLNRSSSNPDLIHAPSPLDVSVCGTETTYKQSEKPTQNLRYQESINGTCNSTQLNVMFVANLVLHGSFVLLHDTLTICELHSDFPSSSPTTTLTTLSPITTLIKSSPTTPLTPSPTTYSTTSAPTHSSNSPIYNGISTRHTPKTSSKAYPSSYHTTTSATEVLTTAGEENSMDESNFGSILIGLVCGLVIAVVVMVICLRRKRSPRSKPASPELSDRDDDGLEINELYIPYVPSTTGVPVSNDHCSFTPDTPIIPKTNLLDNKSNIIKENRQAGLDGSSDPDVTTSDAIFYDTIDSRRDEDEVFLDQGNEYAYIDDVVASTLGSQLSGNHDPTYYILENQSIKERDEGLPMENEYEDVDGIDVHV
ncbi:cell wall protein DAN4-like [Lytechinus variegatus]|uniref:cell wall protein DAN4-like n=1 Tax=Lytechinus variegatus TaxID=7654 RepID=UPI001BB243A7|nr:cell wall protein DAN4-like [Lytechinus variegatus]